MAETKNLCAQIPLDLHAKVCEAREQAGLSTAQYITELLLDYYKMKENEGNQIMNDPKMRTMAFQMPEEMFQRLKKHLERESQRTGKKVSQKQFVLDLIQKVLDEAEQEDGPEQENGPEQQDGPEKEEADNGADLE